MIEFSFKCFVLFMISSSYWCLNYLPHHSIMMMGWMLAMSSRTNTFTLDIFDFPSISDRGLEESQRTDARTALKWSFLLAVLNQVQDALIECCRFSPRWINNKIPIRDRPWKNAEGLESFHKTNYTVRCYIHRD